MLASDSQANPRAKTTRSNFDKENRRSFIGGISLAESVFGFGSRGYPEAFLEEFDQGSTPDEPQGLFAAGDTNIGDRTDDRLLELAGFEGGRCNSAGTSIGPGLNLRSDRREVGRMASVSRVLEPPVDLNRTIFKCFFGHRHHRDQQQGFSASMDLERRPHGKVRHHVAEGGR